MTTDLASEALQALDRYIERVHPKASSEPLDGDLSLAHDRLVRATRGRAVLDVQVPAEVRVGFAGIDLDVGTRAYLPTRSPETDDSGGPWSWRAITEIHGHGNGRPSLDVTTTDGTKVRLPATDRISIEVGR